MKKILLVAVCVMVSFGVYARELTSEEMSVVAKEVKSKLQNPDSAKLTYWDFPDASGNKVYCGLVNSKNEYGSPSGEKIFSVFLAKNNKGEIKSLSLGIKQSTGEPLPQEVISANCAGAGYNTMVHRSVLKTVNETRKKNGLEPVPKELISE